MALVQTPALPDFLSAMFEAASDGLCLVAPDGTVLRANEKWLRATGLRAEQVVGVDINALFPETREFARALHARARAGERVVVPRHRQVILGEESWWDGAISPVAMEGGVGLLITARELAPPDVAHATAALASLQVGLVVRAAGGEVLSTNAAARALLELDEDQIARRSPRPAGWGLFVEDGRPVSELPAAERRRLRGTPGTRVRVELPDGRQRWLSATSGRFASPTEAPGATIMTLVDVTGDVQATEDALQRARERALAKRLNDIELVMRPDGRLQEANDRALEAYGYTREELLGLNILDLRTDGRRTVTARMIEDREVATRFETVHRRKDGTTFPVEVSVRSFEANGGRFLHGIVRDLTARRQAERALQESEQRFRSMADSAPALIAEFDAPGSVAWVNRSWLDFTGLSQEDVRGAGWRASVHPDDLHLDDEARRAAADGQPGFVFTYRLRGVDGSYRSFRGHSQFLHAPSGNVSALHTAFDVTDELEARGRAEAVSRELETLLQTARLGITKVVDRRQVWVNRRMAEMLGRTPEELVGRSSRALYPSEEAYEALGREAQAVLAEGRGLQTEQELVRKDGTRFWARGNAVAIDPRDPAQGALWVVEDVTEQRRQRERLEVSERRYRSLFENLREDVSVYEVERDADGRPKDWILRESNAQARAAGAGGPSPLGKRLTELAGPGMGRYVQRTDAILAGDVQAGEVFVPALGKHYLASTFPLDEKTVVMAAMDITARVAAEEALKEQSARNERTVEDLKDALEHVKTLKGFLPICMHCKKIRDDKGYWDRIEDYISDRTDAEFSHGLCPDCQARYYPEG